MQQINQQLRCYAELKEIMDRFGPVVEGFLAGKQVQYKHVCDGNQWVDTNNPSWLKQCDYRIKPEPVTKYCVYRSYVTRSGVTDMTYMRMFSYEDEAEQHVKVRQDAADDRYNRGVVGTKYFYFIIKVEGPVES